MANEDNFHLGVKAVVRNSSGEVLLLQVNPAELINEPEAYWDLPGGRVKQGQTVLGTLAREMAEETGIKKLGRIVHIGMTLSNKRIPLPGGGSVGLILSAYDCRTVVEQEITFSKEHLAVGWFKPQKAATLLRVKYPEAFCTLIASLR